MSRQRPVGILCSGFGLGFYLPGLLLAHGLRSRGVDVSIDVHEDVMFPELLSMVDRNRTAYRKDFRVALASQKVPMDIRQSTDPDRREDLFERWDAEGTRHFISLSGHWVHLMEEYRSRASNSVRCDLLHLDGDYAPSWRQLRKLSPGYAASMNEIWLYGRDGEEHASSIYPSDFAPIPYSDRDRDRRLVVHGGGWGIGTFEDALMPLAEADYALDLVSYSGDEAPANLPEGTMVYRENPEWRAWKRGPSGEYGFAAYSYAPPGVECEYVETDRNHGLLSIIARSCAIVSKPGAGTLVDSFATATPLIMLDPFGPHEQRNGEIWKREGFGITLREWENSGFSYAVLCEMHERLKHSRRTVPDLASQILEHQGIV